MYCDTSCQPPQIGELNIYMRLHFNKATYYCFEPKEKRVLNFNHVLLYCLTTIVNLTFNYRLQISEQMTDDR